ncbi:MAG: SDR family NAD(P)-dependent oxidoreductase [Actinomycetota bacterium]
MEHLEGRVAVVTGAASGIGLAVAERLVDEGMKVALADIEEDALAAATAALTDRGGQVIAVPTDVRHEEAIQALADATVDAFGAVHVVHNNAGVVTAAPLEQLTTADWEWTLGVDLWSVIFGVKIFLPLIKEAGEGHIVNTASTAGLQSAAGIGPYNVAKFGVVALTETLSRELDDTPDINASVLCPGAVDTKIAFSARNRPEDLAEHVDTEVGRNFIEGASALLANKGKSPAEVADLVVDGITSNRFWLITHEPWKQICVDRAQALATDGSLHRGFGG